MDAPKRVSENTLVQPNNVEGESSDDVSTSDIPATNDESTGDQHYSVATGRVRKEIRRP